MRNPFVFLFLCLSVLVLGISSICMATSVARPFPQHTEYAEGSILPSHLSQAQLDQAVRDAYDQWKNRYLYAAPNRVPVEKYVHRNVDKSPWVSPSNTVSVSEGHGYGMLLLVTMAGHDEHAQEDFDAMFRFFRTHKSFADPRLMAWHQVLVESEGVSEVQNENRNTTSATDGDMDIAMALLMADNQWGSDGEIHYRKEALAVMHGIMESLVDRENYILYLGDWVTHWNSSHKVGTRTSDFMPNHLRTFALVDTTYSTEWKLLLEKTFEIINYTHQTVSQETGLLPDFLVSDRQGNYIPPTKRFLETEQDGDYNWNACRVPWRLATDFLLTGDTSIFEMLTTLNEWIQVTSNQRPNRIANGYYVVSGPHGSAIPGRNYGPDLSFVSPFAVSSAISASNQAWTNALWDYMSVGNIPIGSTLYYPNTLRLLCMIVASGNWWMPH